MGLEAYASGREELCAQLGGWQPPKLVKASPLAGDVEPDGAPRDLLY
jgi:hypothetical protein